MNERRQRVLVIDDDVKLGELVRRILARDYETCVHTSAPAVLDLVAAGERWDLILCDLMLPGMGGMDFHEHLSAVAPELAGRTAFMTGGAFTARSAAFLERRSIPRIEKPFGIAELLVFVTALLGRGRGR